MADITMPQLGETVTEGTITKWFKRIGDPVALDEVLYEVSTDKVDSEVPSTEAGVLTEIRVPEGETVAVGAVLAVISANGAVAAPAPAPAPPAPPAAVPDGQAASVPAPVLAVDPNLAPGSPAEPRPVPVVASTGEPGGAVAANPPGTVASAQDSDPDTDTDTDTDPVTATGDGRLLSPVVRRLVRDHQVNIDLVEGTGPGGRITRSDVQRAIEHGNQPAPAPPAVAAAAMSQSAARTPEAGPASAPAPVQQPAATVGLRGQDQRVPLNRIRKLTGDHMVMSQATSAHTLTVMEADFEAVDRVRRAVRDQWKASEGFSLTYLPFISRAVSDAIAEFPLLNASVGQGELVVHGQVNLGIAVDLGFEGLVAPVVRNADSKRLRAIAREIHDLATRARSRQLRPDDISAGTFTLTNPGQYGTMMQFPIINQPQVAILSTDGVRRKPWVVTDANGSESIGIRPIGLLALAWDHRAFDGAYAAAFLDKVRTIIETRDWAVEIT
ncbi:MAG: dihydrolipoamide acetyltransferase family protein [Acidimicrobiales bacterium]